MKKFFILTIISLCFINNAFAQNSNERDAFELVLAVDEEQYFSAKINESPYVIKDTIIQVYPGEKLFIEADVRDNNLINLKRVESVINKKKTLIIEFKQNRKDKKHKNMMLYIENPYAKKLRYSAKICLLKYGKWITTDVYDVDAGKSSYEIWPDLISSIVLDDFELID